MVKTKTKNQQKTTNPANYQKKNKPTNLKKKKKKKKKKAPEKQNTAIRLVNEMSVRPVCQISCKL